MSTGQKIPFAKSLNRFAEGKINDALQQTGKAFPCSVVSVNGALVTVKFEINSSFTLPNVTIPVIGSNYVREPIQTGDYGVCFAADARLSGVSGQGGIADLSAPSNLTALAFMPISNAKWPAVDPNKLTLTGLTDVLLRNNTHQLGLENENTSWVTLLSNLNTMITELNNLLLIIGPGLTSPTVLTPLTSLTVTNPVVPRA